LGPGIGGGPDVVATAPVLGAASVPSNCGK